MSPTLDQPTMRLVRITPEAVRATRRKTAEEYARDHDLTMLRNHATRPEALDICGRILSRGEDMTYREYTALLAATRKHGLSYDLIEKTWRRKTGAAESATLPMRIGRHRRTGR